MEILNHTVSPMLAAMQVLAAFSVGAYPAAEAGANDDTACTLDRMVVLSRHNIRSPLPGSVDEALLTGF